MSEAELGWIRQRANEGLLAKARRGELALGLPVGYVRAGDGRVEKDPDERVQQAIALAFEKFTELGVRGRCCSGVASTASCCPR